MSPRDGGRRLRAASADPGGGGRIEDLTRAARRGDRVAFERLMVETAPKVHALALRLVGNEQDALDVVQETYLRAFRSIGRFRDEAAVTTWLYRIAANCSASHLRRRRQALPIEAALSLADHRSEANPQALADGAVDRQELVAALAGLPEPLRVVVVLHDVYDLGHDAIVAELGISRAASKVRLHRARRRLRDQLFPERRTARPAGCLGEGAPATVLAPVEDLLPARSSRAPRSREAEGDVVAG